MANEDSMSQAEIVQILRDIHRRVRSTEQILPTLATKEELKTAIEEQSKATGDRIAEEGRSIDERLDLRFKEEGERTRQFIDERLDLRFKEEGERTRQYVDERLREQEKRIDVKSDARIREDGERTRRHMEIIAERMHDDVRLIAEAQVGAEERFERHRAAHLALANRVTRLEDARSSRKPGE